MSNGTVIYEFCDDESLDEPTTFQIIDWGNYVEISMVLINIDKRTGDISK